MSLIALCERGFVPDALARVGMRRLIRGRLASETRAESPAQRHQRFVAELRAAPVAIETEAANEQHYEVPAEFFHRHLGPRLKYSCCLYPTGRETLAQAEEAMLSLYAERAGMQDGMRVLDLGCGWGSLSLWLAEHFPNAHIVGLSNSHSQREFILGQAAKRGLKNVAILTGNVAEFDFPTHGTDAGFDRIFSIEMLEHMKNYDALFAKIARWLTPEGRFFAHVFAHRELSYHFEDRDETDWMTRYFFRGGTMPSRALLPAFQNDLTLVEDWWVDGTHYARTAEHWLNGMDLHRADVREALARAYGPADAGIWFQRWRMFYMAVAELFGYANGGEWGVAHYLFKRK
ncbi:MAG TPA: cyclopropane-fatty-acyl-phospholipid synthase family protein [Burkholderiaceae bacterium]|nr:cyclopropane-fatty-acyl-phospholipid synthase family protein [Burkholderiaceae bacterium]